MSQYLDNEIFIMSVNAKQQEAHGIAELKGWWDDAPEDGTVIALIHSELSEALEALRNGNPPDKHCPDFDALTVELADAVIRILDFAGSKRLPLAEAIVAKMAFNLTRPVKHGGKKF